jgi:hypothetical protein
MPFVNLESYPVYIKVRGRPWLKVPPSGTVARCTERKYVVGKFEGVKLVTLKFGRVYGLPAPVEGTLYIVSMAVRRAVNRPDLASPGDLIQNADGALVYGHLVVNR